MKASWFGLAFALALVGCGASGPVAGLGDPRVEAAMAQDNEDDNLEEAAETPFASQKHEPVSSPRTGALFQTTINADKDGEGLLELSARGMGTDWGSKGRESAVVSLYLDGMHNQDLILTRGEEVVLYKVLLGAITKGSHSLSLEFRRDLSPTGAVGAEIRSAKSEVRGPGDLQYALIAGAPVIFARPDANRSDTPLVLGYEPSGAGFRYTLFVSNEDGGTPVAKLMAVWGRAADIDWCYESKGTGQGGVYQGWMHRTLAFGGRFEGSHPMLRISTKNNLVSDQGDGPFKLRLPLIEMPSGGQASREKVLDQLPWSYKLTGLELAREGKIKAPGVSESILSRLIGKMVPDLRRFVTLEFEHPEIKAKLGFRIKVRGSSEWQLSTGGRFYRAIGRRGLVRTAIALPPGIDAASILAIEPIKSNGHAFTDRPIRITRGFALGADYQPTALPAFLNIPGP